ncbi:MAG: hypothetical protein IPO53_01575 [Chitinophagaceae bacterium]|nr:hypothetical protein [Chitinophagaceae bacterium]
MRSYRLKDPLFGTISRYGAMVLCWSLDKAGPICRSAEDAAIVFAFIHGTDGKDPSAIRHTFNYTGKADWTKIRIAYAENYFKTLTADAPEKESVGYLSFTGCHCKSC